MFHKRYDGRLVRSIDPLMKIMPYIMKERTDTMTAYEDTFPCEAMDAYIKEKAAQGIKMSYMDILIAATVRLIALRPQLNRFIMNGRVYTRPKIWVCFTMHTTLKNDSEETVVKLCFDGTESILEISEKINEAIATERRNSHADNGTDALARTLTYIPSPILKLVVNTLMWMDKHNMLPKAILEFSPFHTTFYITNLKSLGINHVHHHVYNFGTTGLFLAMGKEKMIPVVKDGEIVQEKHMGYSLVSDERICDGLYFALALRQLRKIMKNPAVLETKLEEKVEDVR
ncbi:MAG: 2-oxo acid dehydrogenase subunit E2 [Faecalimonas sp.]|nr:2-oxo acid dehydrogenase subunit E2 [Faecalimonas sp.]